MSGYYWSLKIKGRKRYNLDQPRVPAGHPQGGQWTSEGTSGTQSISSVSTVGEILGDDTDWLGELLGEDIASFPVELGPKGSLFGSASGMSYRDKFAIVDGPQRKGSVAHEIAHRYIGRLNTSGQARIANEIIKGVSELAARDGLSYALYGQPSVENVGILFSWRFGPMKDWLKKNGPSLYSYVDTLPKVKATK